MLRRQLDRASAGCRLRGGAVARCLENVAEELHVLLVVLDHEDLLAGHDYAGPTGSVKTNVAPLTDLAVDPDATAVELDQPLGEGEAEAGALTLLDACVGLLKLLEDPLAVLGRDAGAGVGDRDPHLAVDPRCGDVDGARRAA